MRKHLRRTAACLREQAWRLREVASAFPDRPVRKNLATMAAQCERIATEVEAEEKKSAPRKHDA